MHGKKFIVYRSPTSTGIRLIREVVIERNIMEIRAEKKKVYRKSKLLRP